MKLKPITAWQLAFACLLTSQVATAQVDATVCGDLGTPRWDYRYATKEEHIEVEGAHFVPVVENLIRGNRGYLGGDLAYTLRASPNHHRALVSIMKWSEKLKSLQLPDMPYQVECYFDRGIRYKADDHVVRLLYAQFLVSNSRPVDAVKQLDQVVKMAGDNGFTLYNVGLLYSDMKDFDQALVYAHKAMAKGFFRPELRKRLEQAGRWLEPVKASEPDATQAAEELPATSSDSAGEAEGSK